MLRLSLEIYSSIVTPPSAWGTTPSSQGKKNQPALHTPCVTPHPHCLSGAPTAPTTVVATASPPPPAGPIFVATHPHATSSARSNSQRPPSEEASAGTLAAFGSCRPALGSRARSTSAGEKACGLTDSDHLFKHVWFHNLLFLPLFLGFFPRVLLKINMAMNSGAFGILPCSSPRWKPQGQLVL